MQFLTINQTAKVVGLPHSCLRSMLAAGNLPGFYSGTRFYVNVEMLKDKLERESQRMMKGGEK